MTGILRELTLAFKCMLQSSQEIVECFGQLAYFIVGHVTAEGGFGQMLRVDVTDALAEPGQRAKRPACKHGTESGSDDQRTQERENENGNKRVLCRQ